MNPPRRRALGRGLDALLGGPAPASAPEPGDPAPAAPAATPVVSLLPPAPPASVPRPAAAPAPAAAAPPPAMVDRERGPDLRAVPIDLVRPMPGGQPRRRFDEAALEELASSLREQGVLQPLLVRRAPGGGFELIAGERRWRAAERAGLREVPVIVQEATDRRAFELALVENLQREDLDPIEEAEAYRRLLEGGGMTQEALAARVGKDRATVANALRLLKLPERVRERVVTGDLSAGHARALLALDSPGAIESAAARVAARGSSVRQTEALVRRLVALAGRRPSPPSPETETAVREVEDRLRKGLGTRVKLHHRRGGGGRIEIRYHSLDELDRLIEAILA